MKAKYISILTAIAATAVLVSCNKDLNPGKVDTDQPGETLRTITVSFDAPTKSYVTYYSEEGYVPYFEVGDKILVSNGTQSEICEVFENKSSAMLVLNNPMAITTKLEGPLTAVYPSSAALCNEEGNAIIGYKVPSEQSGRFADANICMADQNAVLKSGDVLRFTTRVAILKFYTKNMGVNKITITSSKADIASGKESPKQITLEPQSLEINPEIGQASGVEPEFWYAAVDVSEGVTGSDLTFESEATTQDEPVVKTSTSNVSLLPNTMYNAFIPYYIKVQVASEEYQYWGYCNVGAFTPDEDGEFFMWGEVRGHRADFVPGNNEAFKNDFSLFQFDDERYNNIFVDHEGFKWKNTPFISNPEDSTFSKYMLSDKITTLKVEDDAATRNWGEGWRMPTKDEFEKLLKSEKDLTFRRIGSGEFAYRRGLFATTHYWSSSIYADNESLAWSLSTDKKDVETDRRYKGYPIRPIYVKPSPEESFGVTVTQYTNGGTL